MHTQRLTLGCLTAVGMCLACAAHARAQDAPSSDATRSLEWTMSDVAGDASAPLELAQAAPSAIPGAPPPPGEPTAPPLDPTAAARAADAAVEDRAQPGASASTVEMEVIAEDAEPSGFLPVEISPDTAAEDSKAGLISITLDDVEVVDVVRMFTRISGANIIATPSNLTGRVTVNLTDVEWKPALESILDMHDLALTEKLPNSKVFSIVPREPGAPPPLKVQTLFLKYATVATVEPVVKAMLASGGTVSLYPSKNALVLRSTAANLSEISGIIAEIDIPRDQVFIEAKFLELSDDAIKDLGINWQVLQGYTVSASSLSLAFQKERTWNDERRDNLGLADNRIRNDQITDLYDVYNDQFQDEDIEFIESPPNSGNYFTMSTVTPTREVEDDQLTSREAESSIEERFNRSVSDVRTAVLGAADFQLVLSALKQMAGVSVVSNPKIIVANEEPAVIHIGQTERPFVSTVTPGQDGVAPLVTYNPGDPVDIGVKLNVTPTVNTESNITVKIEPELTRFLSDAVAPNGQTYPIIGKKTISTIFTLESGKTVAIGGLTETQDRDVNSKVPLLGDIPILGKYLFSHSHKEKRQSETIIFVTVGLAMPGTIIRETGLPEDTELTHRHLISSEARRRAFREELDRMIMEASAARAREASEATSRLFEGDE